MVRQRFPLIDGTYPDAIFYNTFPLCGDIVNHEILLTTGLSGATISSTSTSYLLIQVNEVLDDVNLALDTDSGDRVTIPMTCGSVTKVFTSPNVDVDVTEYRQRWLLNLSNSLQRIVKMIS